MFQRRLRIVSAASLLVLGNLIWPARADDPATTPRIQEEIWALPLDLPTLAYVVRPVGDGPFPLAIMNHGVSMNPRDRSFFPLVEFRDAAMWFNPPAAGHRSLCPASIRHRAGGHAEYHLLPPFGGDGHFLIGSLDSIPIWSPLISQFLDKHR